MDILGIVILDHDGNRLIAKYHDKSGAFGSVKEQRAFEQRLFSKTTRNSSTSDIVLLDGVICLYRSSVDLHFYVLGSSNENELIVEAVLTCLYDAISMTLRTQVEKRTLIDAMPEVTLIIDDICDNGIVLETDATALVRHQSSSPKVKQTLIGAATGHLKWLK